MSIIKVDELSPRSGNDIAITSLKTITGLASQFKITGGTAGQALITDGSGGLSFGNAGTSLPSQTSQAGKFLTTDGSVASWATVDHSHSHPDELPSQTSQAGKFLTTDGTNVNWGTITHPDELPSQTSQAGKFLKTDGTNVNWDTVDEFSVSIAEAAPGSASSGALWWKSDEGRLKIYYNDGSSSQWVDAFPVAEPGATDPAMGGDMTGTASNAQIAADAVGSAEIATDAVGSTEIATGAVGATELDATLDLSGKTVTLPAASVTDHVIPFDDNTLKEEIALLGFRTAANGSLAKYNLVDQTIDAFEDASGISAGDSTNAARDSTGKYFKGQVGSTPTVSGNYDSTGTDGAYSWYKWTTVTTGGTYTTDTAQDYEYLVIAGGGSGAAGHTSSGVGAGGAGGYRTATGFAVAATTISGITVGAGGVSYSSNNNGQAGSNSVFSTITSSGGARGNHGNSNGPAGGSGGGGGGEYSSGTQTGGPGNVGGFSPVEGYAGGDGVALVNGAGGGGGGASAVGGAGSGGSGGSGGAGRSSSIDGTATVRGGGGGGSGGSAGSGSGGSGGGGGGSKNSNATAGTANTGGGGGGARSSYNSGAGGSGIVIIRRETAGVSEGANLTLVSTTTTAQAAPTKGDIVFTYSNGAGSTTLGTDVTAEYSADGGSTWTAMTLGLEGTTGGHNIATAHDVALTSTSGTSMAYRIKTLNQSATKTTRIQAVSLGWS